MTAVVQVIGNDSFGLVVANDVEPKRLAKIDRCFV